MQAKAISVAILFALSFLTPLLYPRSGWAKCEFGYPKNFRETTGIDGRGYVQHRRRNCRTAPAGGVMMYLYKYI